MAITGKPLAATAGALTFQKGGKAVDAACAMLAAWGPNLFLVAGLILMCASARRHPHLR